MVLTDEIRDDMRTTSEELIADSRELAELERRKLNANTNELEELSAEAADLTREMARKAEIQRRLASEAEASN